MCGISGYLTTDSGDSDSTSLRMRETLAHRGPDGAGLWHDPERGVFLAQRRLAILDLSDAGRQPMESACGRYVIVFNGEIYNFRSLRAELEHTGAAFRGHSDTEVLLAAFSAWGVDRTLPRLNGMFAFGLWDRQAHELILARDRYGEKPLYYGLAKGDLLFGSELKALRAHPKFCGEIDRDALALYLRYASVPAPRSIYKGIFKLRPGHMIRIPFDRLPELPAPRRYGPLPAAGPWRGSAEDAVDEFERLLRDAVKLRMEADVPLGAFLSGGVDSSAIVALMQSQSSSPVRTFTAGFREIGFDEAPFAAAVARHLGTAHTEVYVSSREAREVIPKLPDLYDEPFADSSQIPTFLISRLTRSQVTVALSGDAGDELLGGYHRYALAPSLWKLVGWVPGSLRALAAGLFDALWPPELDPLAGGIAAALFQRGPLMRSSVNTRKLTDLLRARDFGALYRSILSIWTDAERAVRGRTPPGMPDPPQTPPRSRTEFLETMMRSDLEGYLPDDILTKVDRASMGVGLEVRIPLLDPRIVGFLQALPMDLRVGAGGETKQLLRKVLYKHVPSGLIERPKMGFSIPIGDWLRGPLRDWAEDLLDPERLGQEGYLHPGPLRARWREHLSGRQDGQHALWAILMFQAWLRAR